MPNFRATLKIHNFDQNQLKIIDKQNKNMYMYQKKIIKMENSLFAIFGKIWPMTLYYSTGSLTKF